MSEGTLREAAGQRYIIERPRLTKLLDESNARVILLLAPAGYGKTTLARQWLAKRKGERVTWYRSTPASTDIAALAADIAHLVDPFVEGVENALLRHLRALPSPEAEARALGRTLGEAMAPWPVDLWLVIDDYHLMTSESTEEFIEIVIDVASPRLLVTSRQRPRWASARRVLYDEAVVLGPQKLALTDSEAMLVLHDVPHRLTTNLLARARGWPAVIRMAALTGRPPLADEALPSDLHAYFAEETYRAAGYELQQALMRLSVYPTLSHDLLIEVLGDQTPSVCDDAVSLGFFTQEPDGAVDLHPLLRTFLETKLRQTPGAEGYVLEAFERLRCREAWDEAFSIAKRYHRPELVESLLDAALGPLLDANRLTTLQDWVAFAASLSPAVPLLDLAEAEIARRAGNYDLGEARALHAARNLEAGNQHLSRAYAVASECAHFAMRPEQALYCGRLGEEYAVTPAERRRAIWDQLVTSTQTDSGDIGALLRRFDEQGDGSAAHTLRLWVGKNLHAMLEGDLEVVFREAVVYLELLQRADNALVTSSFLHRAAFVSMLVGDYERAVKLGRHALREVTATGLVFAVPHITATLAGSNIGLRRFQRADSALDELAEMVARRNDPFERANWHTLRARLLLSVGASSAAVREVKQDVVEIPTMALRAEFLALQALAASIAGDEESAGAAELIEAALATSRDVQGQTLAMLARAVLALQTRQRAAEDAVAAAETILLERSNYDSLVLAYRAFPPLLTELRRRRTIPEARLAATVRRSRDVELAASMGWPVNYQRPPRPLLSPRETEVYELMRQGLMNKEIAGKLFISESTVKVHVRHILEKLGARTRTEAVFRLQSDA